MSCRSGTAVASHTARGDRKMNSSLVSKKVLLTLAVFVAVATTATSALAQVEQPSQINFQGTGLFTKSLKDQSPSYDATKSAGFLTGYSYQFRSEEHTSELQSQSNLVCRLLLEKKKPVLTRMASLETLLDVRERHAVDRTRRSVLHQQRRLHVPGCPHRSPRQRSRVGALWQVYP